MLEHIATNLESVRRRIEAACRRAQRDPAGVTLVAVSKSASVSEMLAAYEAGARHFGENRTEDALPKIAEFLASIGGRERPTWHMIGHLQRRKVRDTAPAFDMVHSVDSLALAEELSKRLAPLGKEMPILLEVNVSGEESKYGFAPAELPAAVPLVTGLAHIRLRGLMTMAPLGCSPDDARPHFAALRRLRDDLATQFPGGDWSQLSMGMTDDFEPAVEEGATLVRVGRAIFQRP
jgi:PLP dependent protein